MNNIIQNILNRQTIRKFKNEAVPQDALELILKSAIRAPSARNTQPCHLRIVQNEDKLREMNVDFKNLVGWETPAYTNWDIHPFYHNAPTVIFIFADSNAQMEAGLMAENIALSCSSLGLGSCMIGSIGTLFENNELSHKWKSFLDVPPLWHFLLCIAIGVPNEKPPLKPREDGHIKFIG